MWLFIRLQKIKGFHPVISEKWPWTYKSVKKSKSKIKMPSNFLNFKFWYSDKTCTCPGPYSIGFCKKIPKYIEGSMKSTSGHTCTQKVLKIDEKWPNFGKNGKFWNFRKTCTCMRLLSIGIQNIIGFRPAISEIWLRTHGRTDSRTDSSSFMIPPMGQDPAGNNNLNL